MSAIQEFIAAALALGRLGVELNKKQAEKPFLTAEQLSDLISSRIELENNLAALEARVAK